MDLKKLFAKHGVESAELLADIQSGIDNSNTIPKSRFDEVIAQRNDARADLSEKESELTNVTGKLKQLEEEVPKLSEYKTKWEQEANRRNEELKSTWAEKAKLFEIDETDKRYEKIAKIKDDFNLGDNLTPEQIQSNLKLMAFMEKTGTLAEPEPAPDYDRGKPAGERKKGKTTGNPYVDQFKKV